MAHDWLLNPAWYLERLWWTMVLFGMLLILFTAYRNRRANRRKKKPAKVNAKLVLRDMDHDE